jgi:hypothetical protein
MRSRALSALVISRRSTSRISDGFGPTRLRPLNTGNAGVRRGRGADPHGSETTSALTTAETTVALYLAAVAGDPDRLMPDPGLWRLLHPLKSKIDDLLTKLASAQAGVIDGEVVKPSPQRALPKPPPEARRLANTNWS